MLISIMPLPSSASSHAKQLLPTVLDERAKTNPNGIFAKVPRSATTYAEGFRSVTYSELVNGINRLAWLLDEFFGKGQGFPTITYLGPSDLRYSMIVVAAIKAGYKVRLMIDHHRISRTECRRLFSHPPGTAKQHIYPYLAALSARDWWQPLPRCRVSLRSLKIMRLRSWQFLPWQSCWI